MPVFHRYSRFYTGLTLRVNHQCVRSFSVTRLKSNDDGFLLLESGKKSIFLISNFQIPNHSNEEIFDYICEIKPETVAVQLCSKRVDLIHKLHSEKRMQGISVSDVCDEDYYNLAVKDLQERFSIASGVFQKSSAIIKPFELFGLLFGKEHNSAIHASLLCKSDLLFIDSNMSECLKRFEHELTEMHSLNKFMMGTNADMNELKNYCSGKSMKEMKQMTGKAMLQNFIKKAPNSDSNAMKNKKGQYLKNMELQKKLELMQNTEQDSHFIDWREIYTLENARAIVSELRDAMPVIVTQLIDERVKNMNQMLKQCTSQKIVAFCNFAHFTGIAEGWENC